MPHPGLLFKKNLEPVEETRIGWSVDNETTEWSRTELRIVVYVGFDVHLVEQFPEMIGWSYSRWLLKRCWFLRILNCYWLDKILLLEILLRETLVREILGERLGAGDEISLRYCVVNEWRRLLRLKLWLRWVMLQDSFSWCRLIPDFMLSAELNVQRRDEFTRFFVDHKFVLRNGLLDFESLVRWLLLQLLLMLQLLWSAQYCRAIGGGFNVLRWSCGIVVVENRTRYGLLAWFFINGVLNIVRKI